MLWAKIEIENWTYLAIVNHLFNLTQNSLKYFLLKNSTNITLRQNVKKYFNRNHLKNANNPKIKIKMEDQPINNI